MKPINLRKAVERRGITALNIFIKFNTLVKYDMFMTLECAWHHHIQGECYTYSVEQAVEKFPQYFCMQ